MRLEDVDLYSPETQEDWYPSYDLLREEAPAYRMPGTDIYVLTRYDDIKHVIKNTSLFPNGMKGNEKLMSSPEANRIYTEEGLGRVSPISSDPPIHREYRRIVDPPFASRTVEDYRERLTSRCNMLIDDFVDDRQCNFFEAFATPLPVYVITELLGLPLDDVPRLKDWSAMWVKPFARGLSDDEEVEVARSGVEFQRYLLDRLAEARANPSDDVMSHFVRAELSGERPLTDKEIINMIEHLYIGGNETTTFALSSGMWLLLERPDVYEALLEDRSLIRGFVEEVLRYESPTMGLYRFVGQDTEIAGTQIPQGSTLHIRFAAGNRDPRMFEDPETFDLLRRNAWRNMAFSLGEHHCPGAGLSRVEQNVAWDVLLDRLPNLRLTPGANDFTHRPGFVLRALKDLHISWG
ncbi:MAG: cytochrome P450 [Acidimicrobiales bacterium]